MQVEQTPAARSMVELYVQAGFSPRNKGQRYDKWLPEIQDFMTADALPAGWSIEHLGVFQGFSGWGLPQAFNAYKLITDKGLCVPIYQTHVPGVNYVLCQNLSFKMFQV